MEFFQAIVIFLFAVRTSYGEESSYDQLVNANMHSIYVCMYVYTHTHTHTHTHTYIYTSLMHTDVCFDLSSYCEYLYVHV